MRIIFRHLNWLVWSSWLLYNFGLFWLRWWHQRWYHATASMDSHCAIRVLAIQVFRFIFCNCIENNVLVGRLPAEVEMLIISARHIVSLIIG